jgi:hypothetical protein
LSEEAFSELLQLQAILFNFPSNMDDDTWLAFNSATSFKVSKAYQHIVGTRDVCSLFKWLWKSCCQHKHKVFFWLILRDRLNTRELLQRKNFFLPDYSCAVCERSSIESGLYLFFQCPFALLCWRYLCPSWQPPAPSPHIQPKDYIMSLKLAIAQPFSLELIILVCWALWITRNEIIFKGIPPSIYRARKFFKDELALLVHKAGRKSYVGMRAWVEAFV